MVSSSVGTLRKPLGIKEIGCDPKDDKTADHGCQPATGVGRIKKKGFLCADPGWFESFPPPCWQPGLCMGYRYKTVEVADLPGNRKAEDATPVVAS